MLYTLAQFGGLYVFLQLAFGIFMNKWTDQHLKQTLINELNSTIEIKNKLRNKNLDLQVEGHRSVRVFPDHASPNLAMNVSRNNEQYPLINEQPINFYNGVNLNQIQNEPNKNYRHHKSLLNEFQNQSLSPEHEQSRNANSKILYDYKDAFYSIF